METDIIDVNPMDGSYVVERITTTRRAKCPKCKRHMNRADERERTERHAWFWCELCKEMFNVPIMFL